MEVTSGNEFYLTTKNQEEIDLPLLFSMYDYRTFNIWVVPLARLRVLEYSVKCRHLAHFTFELLVRLMHPLCCL